ncbi:hypothetical protein HPB50_003781 [Hyalomma asiaticum]|uniref:Uncharacterized protein n=1 Tax=Hyalomma asiaticum TaxID=266040 RepID=A0ACB7S4T3_HYAAI|nr:hypothetical protein HPB50_003781 [Hyalomma asiaticum]
MDRRKPGKEGENNTLADIGAPHIFIVGAGLDSDANSGCPKRTVRDLPDEVIAPALPSNSARQQLEHQRAIGLACHCTVAQLHRQRMFSRHPSTRAQKRRVRHTRCLWILGVLRQLVNRANLTSLDLVTGRHRPPESAQATHVRYV